MRAICVGTGRWHVLNARHNHFCWTFVSINSNGRKRFFTISRPFTHQNPWTRFSGEPESQSITGGFFSDPDLHLLRRAVFHEIKVPNDTQRLVICIACHLDHAKEICQKQQQNLFISLTSFPSDELDPFSLKTSLIGDKSEILSVVRLLMLAAMIFYWAVYLRWWNIIINSSTEWELFKVSWGAQQQRIT